MAEFSYTVKNNTENDIEYQILLTPINIEKLLSFYLSQEWDTKSIRNSITHLSWKEQMATVIRETIKL